MQYCVKHAELYTFDQLSVSVSEGVNISANRIIRNNSYRCITT